MNDFQFWSLFATVITLLLGIASWIVTWVKGLSNRIAKLEIEIAVLKALEEKRK